MGPVREPVKVPADYFMQWGGFNETVVQTICVSYGIFGNAPDDECSAGAGQDGDNQQEEKEERGRVFGNPGSGCGSSAGG